MSSQMYTINTINTKYLMYFTALENHRLREPIWQGNYNIELKDEVLN